MTLAKKEQETVEVAGKGGRDALVTGLMVIAATTAIGGFGVLFSMWWQTGITDPYEVLRIASQEFVGGRRIVAGELAQTVNLEDPDEEGQDESDPDADPPSEKERAARTEQQEWVRLRDFLIGAGNVARAAEEEDKRLQRRVLYEAIPPLQKASQSGFPAGRHAEGYRLLGETLFQVGRFEEATEALQAAIERDPMLQRELLPALAKAQLNSLRPTAAQSLQTIEQFLNTPALEVWRRREGELIRIRALIEMQRWSDAQAAIDLSTGTHPAGNIDRQNEDAEFHDQLKLLQAVLRIRQAMVRFGPRPQDEYEDRSAAVDFLAPTMQMLAELQREASPIIASRARLWSARAHLVEGSPSDALTQLTVVRQQRPFGAEGVVGGLEEIELLAQQGRGIEMLQTTRYVMRELGGPQGFDATLIPFDEFRRRLQNAIDQLRRQGKFEQAIDAARSLPPVFARSAALIQEGMGYMEWAASTIADGTDIGGEVARSASALARSRYRAAGDAFAAAAELEFNTAQFVSIQWSAINAYQEGRHFSHSIRLLEPYLRYEQRRRRPRGLVAYGRALLAVGDAEKAIESLVDCIAEFPRDPLRYDARLLAALAHAELGDLDNARRLLMDNLQDGELTPKSPAWRDSLLTLGELLYRRGYENHLRAQRAKQAEKLALLRDNQPILEEAVRRLDEAVTRYWPMPRAVSAAYLSARAHVLAAQWPRLEAQSPEILDAAKRALRAQTDAQLLTALDGFQELRRHLTSREEEHRLPEAEQAMLRNCFLAEADTLREMNRLEDAATAYRTVSLRYMNEPPALEAILGQARCAKELGRSRESNLLIRQAEVVLQRIPNEWNGRFEETTRFDRNGWEKLLTWMNDRIDNVVGA